ncbi:MAG: YkgJ family cysteine cluster protein [Treponema sp.]|nr:YkgJ family cysteine cluster protein [Treponema sp.]
MTRGILQEVAQEMESGAYDFTKDGECSRCGRCCSAILPVTRKEIKVMRQYAKAHHIKTERHEDEDLLCPFLSTKEKSCMVYEVRPQICRVFRCDKPRNGRAECDFKPDGDYTLADMREMFG